MPTKLVSLYLRVGVGAARLALRLTERMVVAAGSAIGITGDDRAATRAEARMEPTVVEPAARAPRAEVLDRAGIDYEAEPLTPLDPAQRLAKAVDDKPELVEEWAEPGAEEGAGATVAVDEPWPGYGDMNADAVIARLRGATAAELALVELYERAHKRRKTVLAAAEQRLRELNR
jgi:hypothetical protein